MQNKLEVFLGDVFPLYMSNEKQGADNNVSSNNIIVQRTEEEDENRAIYVRPGYSIDAQNENAKDKKVRNSSFRFLCMLCIE